MTLRSRIAMLLAEFLGTAALVTAAINVSRSQIGIGYFVAIGVALAFAVLVLVFGNTSGAHFNPALTLGLWTIRKIGTLQAIAYIMVQMAGAFAAWQLAEWFTGGPLRNIAGESFSWKVFAAEAIGTFVLSLGVAAATYYYVKIENRAAVMGGALFAGVIVASIASNGALNPAIALGNQSWGSAYIFAPLVGSVVGMNIFALLFAPTKQTAAVTVVSAEVSDVPAASEKPARRTTTRRTAGTAKTTATRTRTTTRRKRKQQ